MPGVLLCPSAAVAGAPEPGGSDTILFGEDHFEYADTTALLAAYTDRGIGQPTSISGGHTGKCARFSYTNGGDPDPLLETSFTETVDIYFRFWFRHLGALPNTDPTGSGFKFFMPWHAGSTLRWTCGIGTLAGGPTGFENVGYEFSAHDNQSPDMPNPCMQNISKAITYETCADGNWHKYTLNINNDPNGDGSGDGGYFRLWVDDVLLSDHRPGQPGVPAGGYTTGPAGIDLIQFTGQLVDELSNDTQNFTVDIDDIVVWHT